MNDRRSQIELSTKVIDSYGKSCVYTNAHQHTLSLSLSLSLPKHVLLTDVQIPLHREIEEHIDP